MQLKVDLNGKTAAITGSTSGIGLGIAHKLARNGANIVINSFTNTPDDHALAIKIAEQYNIRCAYIQADMANRDDCRNWVSKAAKQLGSVDILVNNSGIQHVAPIERFPPDEYDKVIAVNMNSAFHTTAIALPLMRQEGWGRIINIASAHGLTASPFKSAYVTAKHGMIGFTKVAALETAEENITANAICPGYVLTPLVEAQIPAQMAAHNMNREEVIKKIILERQPSREFSTVEQIGDIVAFLCSTAADQMTGTTLSVDGGWTAL